MPKKINIEGKKPSKKVLKVSEEKKKPGLSSKSESVVDSSENKIENLDNNQIANQIAKSNENVPSEDKFNNNNNNNITEAVFAQNPFVELQQDKSRIDNDPAYKNINRDNISSMENDNSKETIIEKSKFDFTLIDKSKSETKVKISDSTTNPIETKKTTQFKTQNESGTLTLFLLLIYIVATVIINFKKLFTSYETIFTNEFKDLFYWGRFIVSSMIITLVITMLLGIDIKKSINEQNKYAIYILITIFLSTLYIGQNMFLK